MLERKYVEIKYCAIDDPFYKDFPWLITDGNLGKAENGKKYRIYLEELEDEKEN